MNDDRAFARVSAADSGAVAAIAQFLAQNDLRLERDIEEFVVLWRDERIIACGGLSGDIIKCVAIDETARGDGLALALATELINLAYEKNRTRLFIYTKDEYESLFAQCGFHTLARVPHILVLMENSAAALPAYAASLAESRRPGAKIGCVVLNANPFTNGHYYLLRQAAAQCDWLHVFPVKEDASRFSYQTRLDLIRKGAADIPRLTVHEGSEYIISRATFPCYFIKNAELADRCHAEIDLKIFRQYIAPALGISHRFVGTEPYSIATAYYNRIMPYWFKTKSVPAPPLTQIVLERLAQGGEPISASRVRALLEAGHAEAIAPLVPPATLAYLRGRLAAQAAANQAGGRAEFRKISNG